MRQRGSNWKFYLLIPVIAYAITNSYPEKRLNQKILNEDVFILKCKVSRVAKYNGSSFVHLNYHSEGKIKQLGLRAYSFKGSKLNNDDSLYIVQAIDCPAMKDFYLPFPTKQQFLELKDTSYRINGKLISSEEYRTKHLK